MWDTLISEMFRRNTKEELITKSTYEPIRKMGRDEWKERIIYDSALNDKKIM